MRILATFLTLVDKGCTLSVVKCPTGGSHRGLKLNNMTLHITPEKAQEAIQNRKPYATLGDFKEILNSRILRNHSEDALAVDVLELPLTQTTTFAHWVINYLYANKDIAVQERDLIEKATQAGYEPFSHLRFVKKFIEDTQAHIGRWRDQKTGKTFYQWYPPNDLTNKVQECLDRGDDW